MRPSKRIRGDDAPMPRRALAAAAASVDKHIDDRQHIQGDDKVTEGIDDAHKLSRRHELEMYLDITGTFPEY